MDDPEPDPDATTVCPRCAVGCHLTRGGDDDRATGNGRADDDRATGDDGAADGARARGRPGPANPDGRLCRKGVRAFDVLDDEDRLERPLVRRDGDLVAVSWETAYDRVVEDFQSVLEKRGPEGLAFLGAPHCTNEENYLLGKLARTLGTNDVDNRARLCHVASARALAERLGWPATTNSLDGLLESDVVLVVGANPAARQPVAFNAFVRPAVNDGATLVHVDPVGNRTTRLADVHLAPRPGEDALVLDLLSAGVIDAGGGDRAFVDERTRGYDAFAAGLAELEREVATRAAGVDGEALDRVVDLVADADRVAAMVGTGVEGGGGGDGERDGEDGGGGDGEGGDGGDAEGGGEVGRARAPDALLNLLLLTGNVGRPGTGLYLLRGLVNEQGATDAGCVPDRLPGHQPVTDPEARARVGAEWGVEPPAEPGATAHELLAAFGDRIRGALVVGENPAVSKREPDWLRRKLDALDSLVVVDVAESETTPHADVVLPAAAGVEKTGTVTNLDRQVQRLLPTAAPPGDARPDFEILCELGKRLVDHGNIDDGAPTDAFDYPSPGAAFDELTRVAPSHAGVSSADLDAGGRRWPFDEAGAQAGAGGGAQAGAGAEVLYRESFVTPDGRAPFVPPASVVDAGTADGGLHLVAGGRASEPGRGHAAADRTLRMHPVDADDRGIGQDDDVVVSDGEAVVEATAAPDESVRRGTVYLHAAVADPLLRGEGSAVSVESISPTVTDGE